MAMRDVAIVEGIFSRRSRRPPGTALEPEAARLSAASDDVDLPLAAPEAPADTHFFAGLEMEAAGKITTPAATPGVLESSFSRHVDPLRNRPVASDRARAGERPFFDPRVVTRITSSGPSLAVRLELMLRRAVIGTVRHGDPEP